MAGPCAQCTTRWPAFVWPHCKRLLLGGALNNSACSTLLASTLQAADEPEFCGHGAQHAGHGGRPGPALPQRYACLQPACLQHGAGWAAFLQRCYE